MSAGRHGEGKVANVDDTACRMFLLNIFETIYQTFNSTFAWLSQLPFLL